MQKPKKNTDCNLYTREDGVLVGVGEFSFGPPKGMRKVGKSVEGKIVIPKK